MLALKPEGTRAVTNRPRLRRVQSRTEHCWRKGFVPLHPRPYVSSTTLLIDGGSSASRLELKLYKYFATYLREPNRFVHKREQQGQQICHSFDHKRPPPVPRFERIWVYELFRWYHLRLVDHILQRLLFWQRLAKLLGPTAVHRVSGAVQGDNTAGRQLTKLGAKQRRERQRKEQTGERGGRKEECKNAGADPNAYRCSAKIDAGYE